MNDNQINLLDGLNDLQKKVCISSDNILLTACPGSGKTRTIVYRLAYLQKKYESSRLLNIAMTYTNRAANEIEERLEKMEIDPTNIWTGTIHKFCMQFIINPYAMYLDELKMGYHVIDEFIKYEYLHQIAEELNINVAYDKNCLDCPEIAKKYYRILSKNKEIDFDMILDYSEKLLEQNSFIAQNIALLFRSIHVDEYQDTKIEQYLILKYIIKQNPNINLLFVGDVNQAIYRNLGGIAKTKKELEDEYKIPFKSMNLTGCYRSTQRLIDYYRNFEVETVETLAVSDIKDESGIISYDSEIHETSLTQRIASIIRARINEGVPIDDICVVAPQWFQIFPMAVKLRKLMPDIPFDAPEISPFKYDPMNPFYLISCLVYSEAGVHSNRRRKIVYEVLNILHDEYRISMPNQFDAHDFLKIVNSTSETSEDGVKVFCNTVAKLLDVLHVNLGAENELKIVYDAFLEKIWKRIKENSLSYSYTDLCHYFLEREGIVITTIHGIKGEEYNTVIAFDLLNGHLPHSSYLYNSQQKPYRHDDTNKLLYVLCSRAKKNLFLFSETGRKTKKGDLLYPTDELISVKYDFD